MVMVPFYLVGRGFWIDLVAVSLQVVDDSSDVGKHDFGFRLVVVDCDYDTLRGFVGYDSVGSLFKHD